MGRSEDLLAVVICGSDGSASVNFVVNAGVGMESGEGRVESSLWAI